MPRPPLRHLLIFLPGIMGSRLRQGDRELWALSRKPLWQYLRALGDLLGHQLGDLRVVDDDWRAPDLGDGVVADALIPGLHAVSGLAQHSGYEPIVAGLQRAFAGVTLGDPLAPSERANFYPFPYDWRRDNRATARRLAAFVEAWLPRWRAWSGADDAQVLLVAHSMGGLVARYFLEVLGGAAVTRALITVGTPHRGSLKAAHTLSAGLPQLGADLSLVVRSLTSVYQLLPVYPAVLAGGAYRRVAELELPNVDPLRAREARELFHEPIRLAAIANREAPGYRQRTIPWVGVHQDTFQSATLEGDALTLSYHPPPGLAAHLADGDGTVPRIAATPSDWDDHETAALARFAPEQHGWLTNHPTTLTPLIETLYQIVAPGARDFHGRPGGRAPSFGLGLPDLVLAPAPLELTLTLRDADPGPPHAAVVRLAPAAGGEPVVRPVALAPGQPARLALEGLAPDLYQVEVASAEPAGPAPVHGIVEIAAPASASS